MDTQPLADGTAQREAAKSKVTNLQSVRQGQDIAAQLFDRIIPRRNIGRTMPANVIAKHAEIREKLRNLLIPDRMVTSDGVRKDEDRQSLIPFQPVEHAELIGSDKRHGSIFSCWFWRYARRLQESLAK